MDDGRYLDPQQPAHSDTTSDPESASLQASGIFSHCRYFTVTAQTLNNVTNYNTAAIISSGIDASARFSEGLNSA
ncbi:hypothetical protein K438DRAFT_1974457 [Mycena galopus ATCC 62051]|nr:hypothetical protein K438DRAFT_1974457 [Mycena galopus ATCC 62051]